MYLHQTETYPVTLSVHTNFSYFDSFVYEYVLGNVITGC